MRIAVMSINYNVDFDFDRDGNLDSTDLAHMNGMTYKAAIGGRSLSDPNGPDNEFGYAGYVFNHEQQFYTVRYRSFSPSDGRWWERDPAGYIAGMNMYRYAASAPVFRTAPN